MSATTQRGPGDTLSFSSPESDFTSGMGSMMAEKAEKRASPPDVKESTRCSASSITHSDTLSFASPESDFTGGFPLVGNDVDWEVVNGERHSDTLSFASPESDFTGGRPLVGNDVDHEVVDRDMESDLAYSLSFSSPESDFTGLPLTSSQRRQLDNVSSTIGTVDIFPEEPADQRQSDLAYSLSFASESNSDSVVGLPLTPIQKQQLRKLIVNNLAPHSAPITMSEALASTGEAKVLTMAVAPFEIKHVNDEWVSLCGYTPEESIGKDLGILQGPLTDEDAVSNLISAIEKGDYENAVANLTNYSKNGDAFENDLTVTPVVEEDSEQIVALMGILRPLSQSSAMKN